jgi:hypothetical protein
VGVSASCSGPMAIGTKLVGSSSTACRNQKSILIRSLGLRLSAFQFGISLAASGVAGLIGSSY